MPQTTNTRKISRPKNKSVPRGKNGGKRPGAGRPKGSKNKATIAQREALEQFKNRVRKRVGRLFHAQVSVAEGLQCMIKVEPNGTKGVKHVVVDDPKEMCAILDAGLTHNKGIKHNGTYYYLTIKPPDSKAIDSLLDRTFGRPSQNVDLTSQGEGISVNVKFDDKPNPNNPTVS